MAHAQGETGNALAILNLGAGLGAFVGPAVVTALVGPLGYAGVAWALAGLYVISFGLVFALKLPGNARVLLSPDPTDLPPTSPTTDEGGPALVDEPHAGGIARRAENAVAAGISELGDPVN